MVGWNDHGRPVRRTKTCKSQADAVAWLGTVKTGNLPENDSSERLREYLDRWLTDYVKPNLAWNTYLSYRQQMDHHVIPKLGDVRMKSLTPLKVQRFIAQMQEENVPSATRRYVVTVLGNALRRAVRLQVIQTAPTMYVDKPTHRPKEIHPFTEAEAMAILKESERSHLHVAYAMALLTGARQGEIFGAYWEDIDEKKNVWHIRRQLIYSSKGAARAPTKTLSSARNIDLMPRLVEALHERKKIAMRDGVAASPYILCTSRGTPFLPTNFWVSHWKPLLARLNIEHRGFHHCRHTYATLAINAGVPVNVVSYVLGHSNSTTTLRTYAHYLPSQQRQATDAIAKLLG